MGDPALNDYDSEEDSEARYLNARERADQRWGMGEQPNNQDPVANDRPKRPELKVLPGGKKSASPGGGLFRPDSKKGEAAAGLAKGAGSAIASEATGGVAGMATKALTSFFSNGPSKKQSITGGIISVVIVAITVLGAAPGLEGFTVIHAFQVIGAALSNQDSESADRSGHLLRDLKAARTGNLGYTRVGLLGAKWATSALNRMEKNGLEVGKNLRGTPTEFKLTQEKFANNNPEVRNMNDSEFKSWVADNVKGVTPDMLSGSKGVVNINTSDGLKLGVIGEIGGDLQTKALGAGKIQSFANARVFKKFWGLGSIFHPFDKLFGQKLNDALEAARAKSENKGKSDDRLKQEAAAEVQDGIESERQATPETQGKNAQEEVKNAENGLKGKVTKYGLQIIGTACIARGVTGKIVEIQNDTVRVPAAAAAAEIGAAGAQLMSPNKGNEVDPHDVDNAAKKASAFLSSPQGRALQSQPVTDGAQAAGDKALGEYAPAFNDGSTAASIHNATTELISFGTGSGILADGVCDAVFVGVVVAALRDVAVAATTFEDGGASLAFRAGAVTFADKIVENVGGYYAIKQLTNFIVGKNAVPKITEKVLESPTGGAIIANGARGFANATAIATGGINLHNPETTIRGDSQTYAADAFENKSMFAKMFDTQDYRSLTGKLADSLQTTNVSSIASGMLGIGGKLGSIFSSLVTTRAFADSNDISNGYKWDFSQYGIPDFIMKDPDLQNTYDNADVVAGLLNNDQDNVIKNRAMNCFGAEITNANSDNAWDVIPKQATDTHTDTYASANCDPFGSKATNDNADKNWARMIMFVFDTMTAKSVACYSGTDGQSCKDIGLTSDSSGDSAPVTGPGGSFAVGTLNVLGANHTTRDNGSPGDQSDVSTWPNWKVRAPHEVQAVKDSGVAAVGFQEIVGNQEALFEQLFGSSWSFDNKGIQNTIAWRNDVFDAKPIDSGSFIYPYYHNSKKVANWVLLRQTSTGQQVILTNFHPEAHNYPGSTEAEHDEDIQLMADQWNTVLAQKHPGVPIIMTGDMNDSYDAFFCQFGKTTTQGALSADGSKAINGKCSKGSSPGSIDWIIASGDSGATFSSYKKDGSLHASHWTDHDFVTATVTFPSTGASSTPGGTATVANSYGPACTGSGDRYGVACSGQCVDYIEYLLNKKDNKPGKYTGFGTGSAVVTKLINTYHYTRDSRAQVGDVVSWPKGGVPGSVLNGAGKTSGHVGVVIKVNSDDSIVVGDYNFVSSKDGGTAPVAGSHYFGTHTVPAGAAAQLDYAHTGITSF
jgi:hypothetical protein